MHAQDKYKAFIEELLIRFLTAIDKKTQKEIAVKTGLSQSEISLIKRGKKVPSPRRMAAIIDRLEEE